MTAATICSRSDRTACTTSLWTVQLAGTTYGGKSSPEAGMGAYGQYHGYSAATTPGLESGVPQQARYVDPYGHTGQHYAPAMGVNHSAQGSQTSLGSYGNLLYGGANPAVAAAAPAAYGPPGSQTPSYGGGSSVGRRASPAQAQQISPGTVIAPMNSAAPQYQLVAVIRPHPRATTSRSDTWALQRLVRHRPTIRISQAVVYGQPQSHHAPAYSQQRQGSAQLAQQYEHGQQPSGGSNYYPSHNPHAGSGYQQGGPYGLPALRRLTSRADLVAQGCRRRSFWLLPGEARRTIVTLLVPSVRHPAIHSRPLLYGISKD